MPCVYFPVNITTVVEFKRCCLFLGFKTINVQISSESSANNFYVSQKISNSDRIWRLFQAFEQFLAPLKSFCLQWTHQHTDNYDSITLILKTVFWSHMKDLLLFIRGHLRQSSLESV